MDDDFETFFSYLKKTEQEEINTQSTNCINCSEDTLFSDRTNGTIVCTSCGSVNENSFIDESASSTCIQTWAFLFWQLLR